MQTLANLASVFTEDISTNITGVPDGFDAMVLSKLATHSEEQGKALAFIASDHQQLSSIQLALNFFAPWCDVIEIPAWDCLPYDRVSPSNDISARRISAFSRLAKSKTFEKPTIVLTTANALVQKVVPISNMQKQVFNLAPGNRINMDELVGWLARNGFERNATVRDRGEFSVRGGIVDFWAPGVAEPVRFDFFGDTLESIRNFDPATQRTTKQLKSIVLAPMSEVVLGKSAIKRFRGNYVSLFGGANHDDALYQAISAGRRFSGMEHWLPLFYSNVQTLFDYFENCHLSASHSILEAVKSRSDQIEDHFKSRKTSLENAIESGTPYKPISPDAMYLREEEVKSALDRNNATVISPFETLESGISRSISVAGKQGRTFAGERAAGKNVFEAVAEHIKSEIATSKNVLVGCWSDGSRDRLRQVLSEHGLTKLEMVNSFADLGHLKPDQVALGLLPIEQGFNVGSLTVVAEQDVLGDRLVRRSSRKRKGSDFLAEVSSLNQGDIVVHVDHGIARFAGLQTIEAAGAPHDCLELRYAGDDKLFLPVENIELLSRYGNADSEVQLDRLGGVAWQARKAKLKKRILEMADQLIRIAAERTLKSAERFQPPDGLYDEFAARFPYEETEDQLGAIESVFEDMASGAPMDRLICGDVGFGKTEVALRAAFIAAIAGRQVAVVVPTTLLARQHFRTFIERFQGLPVKIAHASRLVSSKELAEAKAGIKDGTVDIVVGTHALLGNAIEFDRLGLLIIDEEQRFGVKHKERLKEIRADVHVLTLSATPIPRTLQLAMTGVRELSLITTAPVDRMAVRTFVMPFDSLTVREALLRERFRGGQSFYVCPRVSDIDERLAFLQEHVPELKVGVAHGQMPPGQLDDVMNAFYDGQYDVLLSTTIVESGLDIPTANTLIVHRADMFGLAQLYQLRGRVGRSKARAYALFTLPVRRTLTPTAERRLKVLQSLDSLGAGFELASHDLDIRGSGNLLGEEQSGQIREVGYELYQQMLEEAVAELRHGGESVADERWSPQITIGTPVLIPESYVPDLSLRLGLYRRLADISAPEDIDAFGAEMIDRFGSLPEEVEHLLKIVYVKGLCLKANVEKLDAGPAGIVISIRNNDFPNPAALLKWIGEQGSLAKIRPNQSVVVKRDWADPEKRLKGCAVMMQKLSGFVDEVSHEPVQAL